MDEPCALLDAEVHTPLRPSDVHVLYLRTLGEMLDDGSAIENRVDRQALVNISSHIAQHYMEASAYETLEGVGEIIVEKRP